MKKDSEQNSSKHSPNLIWS